MCAYFFARTCVSEVGLCVCVCVCDGEGLFLLFFACLLCMCLCVIMRVVIRVFRGWGGWVEGR